MARMFALTFGIIYVLVALIELIWKPESPDFLFYTSTHNIIHWATGLLGLVAYFQGEAMSRLYAQVFGVVFLLVAVLGFIPATRDGLLNDILGYSVNLFYNIVHLVTGVFGIWAGFVGTMDSKKS